jgi:hypothetical protein
VSTGCCLVGTRRPVQRFSCTARQHRIRIHQTDMCVHVHESWRPDCEAQALTGGIFLFTAGINNGWFRFLFLRAAEEQEVRMEPLRHQAPAAVAATAGVLVREQPRRRRGGRGSARYHRRRGGWRQAPASAQRQALLEEIKETPTQTIGDDFICCT